MTRGNHRFRGIFFVKNTKKSEPANGKANDLLYKA